MNTPVVSVLMAVYNAERWLPQALSSLLDEQTLRDIEVLAVDDASTDSSFSMLEQRAACDSRLRLFRQHVNRGQAVARNVALCEARGEFVCMVDADDWLSPDALQSAVDVFLHHPRTDSVFFRLVYHYEATGEEADYGVAGASASGAVTLPTSLGSQACFTGEEAFRLSLDWTLHGLYLTRRELHLLYPYDDSFRLFSDDNTTRLHYLHSREVRSCAGVYYYRRHAESATAVVTPQRFLHMKANLHMRQIMEAEGVSPVVIASYETHRWHNYLGQLWLFFDVQAQFEETVRRQLRQDFREVYATFHHRLPFVLFWASQWLRWKRRRL